MNAKIECKLEVTEETAQACLMLLEIFTKNTGWRVCTFRDGIDGSIHYGFTDERLEEEE